MIDNDWIAAPEVGEPEDGPWEVFRMTDDMTHLLAYGLTEEMARTLVQRLNG